MKVVYIAGPYRGRSAWEIAQNIRAAEYTALQVWKLGAAALCPHANAAHFQGEEPDDLWLRGCLAMLGRCDAVLLLPEWYKSAGAREEREAALRLGIPVLSNLNGVQEWLREEEELNP